MKFTKKEMYLLEYCFDMNNGDKYVKEECCQNGLSKTLIFQKKK